MYNIIVAKGDGYITLDDIGKPISDFKDLIFIIDVFREDTRLANYLKNNKINGEYFDPAKIIQALFSDVIESSWSHDAASNPGSGGVHETWQVSSMAWKN